MDTFLSFTLSFIFLLLIVLYHKNILNYFRQYIKEEFEVKILFILLIFTSIFPIIFVTIKGSFPKTLLLLFILYFILSVVIIKKKVNIPKFKYRTFFSFLIVIIVTAFYSLFISNKTLPIAEGWYSVYAKLINNGMLPYKDFGLLFMPLYSYIIAFITALFGYKIIVLRIFGVIVFTLLSSCMFIIYKKLFKSNSISMIVSITSAIYLQSEVVQIFYDYIRIFDLITYLGIVFMILYLEKRTENNKFSLSLFFSGIFLSLSFLIRQNSGAITIFYLFVLIIFLSFLFKRKKQGIKDLISYIIALLIPLLCFGIYFKKVGILNYALTKTTGSAIESKGGILTVLFAWIPRVIKSISSYSLILLFINVFFIVLYLFYKKYKDNKKINLSIFSVFASITIFIGIFACFYINKLRAFAIIKAGSIPNILFFIIVELFIFELFYLIFKKNNFNKEKKFHVLLFSILGMIIAINYGSGTSAGLSEGQSALGLGLILGLILYLSNNKIGMIIKPFINLLCIFICLSIFSYKYNHPYSWWGIGVDKLDTQTYKTNIKELESIYVSKNEKKVFEDITKYVKNNSSKEDKIFEFPHSPIFYLMTDRYPNTYSIVQWFDVCTDEMLQDDIKILKEEKPKFIIHVHIPEFAINEHEKMFRGLKKSGFRKMDEYLTRIEKKEYKLVKDYYIQGVKISLYEISN